MNSFKLLFEQQKRHLRRCRIGRNRPLQGEVRLRHADAREIYAHLPVRCGDRTSVSALLPREERCAQIMVRILKWARHDVSERRLDDKET